MKLFKILTEVIILLPSLIELIKELIERLQEHKDYQ